MRYIRGSLALMDEAFKIRASHADRVGPKVACRAGCSACCYDYALVSAAEFAPMLSAFEKLPAEDQQHVRDQNARWIEAHKDLQEKHLMVFDSEKQADAWFAHEGDLKPMAAAVTTQSWKAKTPCSFLKDGKCLIYADRPIACRGHNLWDARGPSVCETVLHEDIDARRFEVSDVATALLKGFKDAGLPIYPFGELNVVLERWLSYKPDEDDE
jgi:Fe-S-cluster containining protein